MLTAGESFPGKSIIPSIVPEPATVILTISVPSSSVIVIVLFLSLEFPLPFTAPKFNVTSPLVSVYAPVVFTAFHLAYKVTFSVIVVAKSYAVE